VYLYNNGIIIGINGINIYGYYPWLKTLRNEVENIIEKVLDLHQ
jgi:hypothetical protein